MFRRLATRLSEFIKNQAIKMGPKPGDKRTADGSKVEQEVKEDRKRKVALLIAYNGKGYYGLQYTGKELPTIEGEILKALLKVDLIPQDHFEQLSKMSFQRAARTDKGVSAAGNALSLKMRINEDNLLEKINAHLPAQIQVMDCIRTTKNFNSWTSCHGRTYNYITPTYAFSPVTETVGLDYRTNVDILEHVNEVLEQFKGTHNFHNFTSGVKFEDHSAKRYIKTFECGLPFVKDNVEFCVLSVTGQSFMLHQIRKMVGLTIAIVRGYTTMEAIEKSWQEEKVDIPKAPGLGLVLDKLYYDQYNKKLDQISSEHPKIEWSHIKEKQQKFKEEYIFSEIIKEEIETQSMMEWMKSLVLHTYAPSRYPGVRGRKQKYLLEMSELEDSTSQGISQSDPEKEGSEASEKQSEVDDSTKQMKTSPAQNVEGSATSQQEVEESVTSPTKEVEKQVTSQQEMSDVSKSVPNVSETVDDHETDTSQEKDSSQVAL